MLCSHNNASYLTSFACALHTRSDFDGFPEESKLPIDYMTKEHREVISTKCSHPRKKKKFPYLPTSKPIAPRLLTDNPDPSPSLFKHIIEKTSLPDDAFKWNKNNTVREAGMKLKPALELIKIGEDHNLQFSGVDSNAASTTAVTRLFGFHFPPGPKNPAKLGPAEQGILHAVGEASVASNFTLNTLTHQDVNILSMTQGVGLDKARPVFEGTTAVFDVFPYFMPADMCSDKNGEAYKKYLEVSKKIRYVVKEYIKALTQEFPNLRDITLFGEAFNFFQDNPDMVDPMMVTQLKLDVGGLAHSSTARMGTRRKHSIAQLKVSGTYYGDMLQNPFVFDLNDPKMEMYIQSTPRLMMDEVKHSENTKAGLNNMSDEDKEKRIANIMETCDEKREDDIPGLITIPAGSEHSILTHCPECKKQRHTTQIISSEDAGCNNMKKGEQNLPAELYKDKALTELIYTSEAGKTAAPQIIAELKDRHKGKHVPGRATINNKINDGTDICVRNDNQNGKIVHRYYARKVTTSGMLKVLPRCSKPCQCYMIPVDESQSGGTIPIMQLHKRQYRGFLPTKKRKSTVKQKKDDSDNEVEEVVKKRTTRRRSTSTAKKSYVDEDSDIDMDDASSDEDGEVSRGRKKRKRCEIVTEKKGEKRKYGARSNSRNKRGTRTTVSYADVENSEDES